MKCELLRIAVTNISSIVNNNELFQQKLIRTKILFKLKIYECLHTLKWSII